MDNKWFYDLYNSDTWDCYNDRFDGKHEAIKNGLKQAEHEGVDKIRVGMAISYRLSDNLISAEDVLDRVVDNVYDDLGECAEDYLGDVQSEHREELEKDLNQVLVDWIVKHGYEPNFYQIINIEEVEVK